jgi:hypothetical protein
MAIPQKVVPERKLDRSAKAGQKSRERTAQGQQQPLQSQLPPWMPSTEIEMLVAGGILGVLAFAAWIFFALIS